MNLLPYQKEDVSRICGPWRDRSVYLGHEMGTGKSAIALVSAERLEAHNILIVCPASVRSVWPGEIEKFYTAPSNIITVTNGCEYLLLRRNITNFVVISYDLAVTEYLAKQLFQKVPKGWDLIIFDECHCLGNRKSKRTQLCLGSLYRKAKKCLFLSGSIQRDKIENVWPVFKTLCPKHIPSYWKFIDKYVYWTDGKYGIQFLGGTNLEELGNIAKDNFLIRRLKKDVLKDLPDKLEQKLTITLESTAQDKLEEAKREFSDEQVEKCLIRGDAPDEAMSTYRRELGEEKVGAAVNTILGLLGCSDEVDSGDCKKLVVFCYHLSVYHALGTAFRNHNISWVGINGSVSHKERAKAVRAFQERPGVQVFLGTFAAAEGITLTAASTVLFVEMSWQLSQNEQAQDRLHRIGQKDTVWVKYLIAENTLDEPVYKVYKRKSGDKRRLLDEQTDTGTTSGNGKTRSNAKSTARNDSRSRPSRQKATSRARKATGASPGASSQ